MIFRVIALVLMAAFYACYYIKLFGQKKKGIKTTQIGSGKTGFVKGVECTMMVATILVVVVELVSIILGTTLLPPWARWLGVGIGTVGVAVFITAVITMQDSWRAGVSKTDKTALITNGIFAVSRNPAFLGFDLLYIGILLMFFNWVLLAASAFAALMFHLQIVNVEEEFLLEAFGDEYLNYRKKVNRYFGRRLSKRNGDK
ncbi:MAG: isoprenylcysteine carboxylmethyltransferase family protein [Oscillospiraceae bacterium]|nr:isoprenylcysteine carboxylmethyltransferase family protein [Oscillospiraceae bacterium]